MIIQCCPRCGSSRIRRGYRRTPWWQAIFGRYNLLCNSCNWEFVGLAIPGTVPEQSSRKRKRRSVTEETTQTTVIGQNIEQFAETEQLRENISSNTDSNRDREESLGDLQPSLLNSSTVLESQSDSNPNILSVLSQTKATRVNNSGLKEASHFNENERVLDNASNQATIEITASDGTIKQRPKVRKRTKRKK